LPLCLITDADGEPEGENWTASARPRQEDDRRCCGRMLGAASRPVSGPVNAAPAARVDH